MKASDSRPAVISAIGAPAKAAERWRARCLAQAGEEQDHQREAERRAAAVEHAWTRPLSLLQLSSAVPSTAQLVGDQRQVDTQRVVQHRLAFWIAISVNCTTAAITRM